MKIIKYETDVYSIDTMTVDDYAEMAAKEIFKKFFTPSIITIPVETQDKTISEILDILGNQLGILQ